VALPDLEPKVVAPRERTAELIRRSRNGDADAFRSLYEEHVGVVHAICLRMSGGGSVVAAELTQEVFVRAWQSLKGFRGNAAFGTWLHRIACNVVLESQRGTARKWSRIADDETVVSRVPARTGIDTESRIDLERAIAILPEKARNALVLHDIHGYRCHEVAALTGTAVGTIQAHLHRARRLLREMLER
jgi:RNA polymerase sigma factor (sigma-70 family)